ncbi:MAG: M1 family metallopeptidase [Gemmatimonadales bacterium]|nr:M1 family metallopeptidase [Gemmatimonadales bacterium]
MPVALVLLMLDSSRARAQRPPDISGGPLSPEQASYDVSFYDLALRIDPADSTIAGSLSIVARVVQPLDRLVLDLDTVFTVRSVTALNLDGSPGARMPVERRGGQLWIETPTLQPGERIAARIDYRGRPRTGPGGGGGFIWSRTRQGAPWIAVSCELFGADLWWPVKDHPSDEPDSMALHFSVPAALTAVSNGRSRGVTANGDGTRTHHWFVSTPINNYAVTVNVAPYAALTTAQASVAGDTIPVTFWALPDDSAKARAALPEFLDHLRFYERLLGPYPFRHDKYGVAEAPFLGMEHQSLIAYGAGFRDDAMAQIDWGFDALHEHELAHEWFGNMLTPPDFSDIWLHEAFAQYMQPLYAEARLGRAKARELMRIMGSRIQNHAPIAARGPRTIDEAYSGDIYYKGAWVLHSLRYLMGDARFRTLLHQWTDPEPPVPVINDACRCRFATTDDFVRLASRIAGRDLNWFFDVYVRQAEAPALVVTRGGARTDLSWKVPGALPFPMPVEVRVGARLRRIEMPGGRATIDVPEATPVEADPNGSVLGAGR